MEEFIKSLIGDERECNTSIRKSNLDCAGVMMRAYNMFGDPDFLRCAQEHLKEAKRWGKIIEEMDKRLSTPLAPLPTTKDV